MKSSYKRLWKCLLNCSSNALRCQVNFINAFRSRTGQVIDMCDIIKRLLEKLNYDTMISEIEQQCLDIDWFFSDSNNLAFVASGGGKLPKSVEECEDYNLLASYFINLPSISDVKLNDNLHKILKSKPDERYLNDFIIMARKGLYTFDKTVLNNFIDTNYHLVAFPLTPLKFSDLSEEIKDILQKTIISKNLSQTGNVNSLEIS